MRRLAQRIAVRGYFIRYQFPPQLLLRNELLNL
jgi:hypothetical protein